MRIHDFLIKELGRAVPYGICDLAADAGWVSVGMDHDTAAFAVQTIRRWWQGDTDQYPKGIVVSDAEMAAISITRAEFHREWNYTISPNNRSDRAVDS